MLAQGHQVRVIDHDHKKYGIKCPYIYEGIEVFENTKRYDQYAWADVILTHLDYTRLTLAVGAAISRPVVHIVHNDHPYESVKSSRADTFIVYNSQWIADKLKYDWPSIVVPPPCDYRKYKVCENPEGNEYVTLISLNKNKGGEQFYELARRMPDRKFLGVIGSYDEQIIQELPNVKIIPNTPNILDVYKQTRILLMLSEYESWGMTATEAMCNGIPVIANPTPGLKENLGEAGIYKDRKKLNDWVKAIKELDNKEKYRQQSIKCNKRALELDPIEGFKRFEQFLYEAASRKRVTGSRLQGAIQ